MNYKIFIKVFFEKSKYLVMYSLSIITFWYALFINVASVAQTNHYEQRMPDVEMYGQTADSKDSYMLYQNLDSSLQSEFQEEGVKAYGFTVRNLFTFSDAYYQVSYRIYGAEDEFLKELAGYLRRGRLPEAGKKEAVIGRNVAKFYDLEIGDIIDFPLTLDENSNEAGYGYVVSGIISADAWFFGDGIYISSDTYETVESDVNTNAIYVYVKNEKSYQSVIQQVEVNMEKIGGFLSYFDEKASLYKTIQSALIKTIPLSAIVLTAIFVSLMKYTGRKIGLMKALGISDLHIMKLMIKGFGVYNVIGIFLSYLSLLFVRLSFGFSLPLSVILYSVYSFAIIFFVTIVILFILCKRISPRLAMYTY